MKWSSRALGSGLLALVLATTAVAQTPDRPEPKSIPVNVTITHLSDEEGGIDPRARALESQLGDQGMHFKRIKVIETRRLDLRVDEVGTVRLPDGSTARLSPLHRDEDGVLMAVDVEGSVRMDVRVRNEGRVVIGGPRYKDGKLAITIETIDE